MTTQKIEKKVRLAVLVHPDFARAYGLEEGKSFQPEVEEIVKEDASSVTFSYLYRGWKYVDTVPKQHCIISKGEESLENAERRIQKTGVPMPTGTKSSASSKKE